MDCAKYGDLYIFVIDFDKIDGEIDTSSSFFQAAYQLADKVTRSQGGGYHMFYGVDKTTATPLFDSINLLTADGAKSFVRKTSNITVDGKNKVDMFCDARHFIYEWEPWDNTVGLTDKTQRLYELIKENFELKRPMSGGKNDHASGRRGKGVKDYAMLEDCSESELVSQMSMDQQIVFADLQGISCECPAPQWFSIGLDIYHVFGEELGGQVFFFWSKPGHSFQPRGCSLTWANICDRGPVTELYNSRWAEIMRGTPKEITAAEAEARDTVPSAAEQFPLPLEENSSAAGLTFRGLPIAWENVTTEEDGKQRTAHWIVWNGSRSKREDFFKQAYPDRYNKIKKRVKFLEQAADNVLWLTSGQRTKLGYEVLTAKYELVEVDELDNTALTLLCWKEEDNKTADDLLSRLRWPNGLAKIVTFGVGMKLDAAAQHTWCYSVDYQEDKAIFEGRSMTWECWQK